MARKRFITSDMSIDERIASIAVENPVAALMWPWFITGFDDWGRMEAVPVKIKLSIFPAFPYTPKDIEDAINLYDKYGIVHKYEVDDREYIAIEPEKYYKYQTYIRGNKREIDGSNCPPPPNPPWDSVKGSAEVPTRNNNHADARTCTQVSADERKCIPSPSPSPSPTKDIYICAPDGARASTDPANADGVEAPKGVTAKQTLKAKTAEMFAQFWETYPKKRSKGQAEKTWAKLKPDEQLFKAIIDGLERAKTSVEWQKDGGQYIPHPSTWLNAKGWEDEYPQQGGVINGGSYAYRGDNAAQYTEAKPNAGFKKFEI